MQNLRCDLPIAHLQHDTVGILWFHSDLPIYVVENIKQLLLKSSINGALVVLQPIHSANKHTYPEAR